MTPRSTIVNTFAEWTAFSALRSGLPNSVSRLRGSLYPLIQAPDYTDIISRKEVSSQEFDSWHELNTLAICEKATGLPVGWATKMINVYLKTRVYLAGDGSPSLVACIHPPIDNGLWQGIKVHYRNEPEIFAKTHVVNRIKDIAKYPTYRTIIEGCGLIAEKRNCLLIEVEELWMGTIGTVSGDIE